MAGQGAENKILAQRAGFSDYGAMKRAQAAAKKKKLYAASPSLAKQYYGLTGGGGGSGGGNSNPAERAALLARINQGQTPEADARRRAAAAAAQRAASGPTAAQQAATRQAAEQAAQQAAAQQAAQQAAAAQAAEQAAAQAAQQAAAQAAQQAADQQRLAEIESQRLADAQAAEAQRVAEQQRLSQMSLQQRQANQSLNRPMGPTSRYQGYSPMNYDASKTGSLTDQYARMLNVPSFQPFIPQDQIQGPNPEDSIFGLDQFLQPITLRNGGRANYGHGGMSGFVGEPINIMYSGGMNNDVVDSEISGILKKYKQIRSKL